MSVFELLSMLFSYIFITLIYLFIFSIIRLIYMDIKYTSGQAAGIEIDENDDDDNRYEGEYFGILRVVAVRKTTENLSDEYILDKDAVTIGRLSSESLCDIQIDDTFLSREHLELTFDGTRWLARDLDSRNGSFVNGEAIDECELQSGDEVAIGGVIFVLETD